MESVATLPQWRANLATIAALMARAKNELLRVPGAAIPGVLAPTIFFLGLNGVFGALTQLNGFSTGTYESFIVPVSMLQGAGFTGAAAGVNLARDIEGGWTDRLLVSPAPRWVLLAGTVLSASARALIPATFVFIIALAARRRLAGRRRAAGHLPDGRRDGRRRRLLGLGAGAALQEPVGGAADAGGDDGADPDHHRLRAAGPAAAVDAQRRRSQPGDARDRSGAAGLRRRRQLGRNLARDRRPGGLLTVLGAWALREMRRTAA